MWAIRLIWVPVAWSGLVTIEGAEIAAVPGAAEQG